MFQLDLVKLMDKLDAESKMVFESSAKYANEINSKEIVFEHCLFQMLLTDNNLVSQFLTEQGIKLDSVKRFCLALVKSDLNNNHVCLVSESLIQLLSKAWLLASVNYQSDDINALHLLFSYLNGNKNDIDKDQLFLPISMEALKVWVEKYTNKSDDNTSFSSDLNIKPSSIQKESTTSELHPHLLPNYDVNCDFPALAKYTVNLTEKAKEGKIDPVVGRNNEIRKVINVLCQKRQNNPMLMGDAGVGKTAIVEGLALQIVSKQIPAILADVQIYLLDLTLLQAGASVKGEFEQRLKDVIAEVKQCQTKAIVFIDEAHSLIGAGGHAGQSDAANILKPALARGEFRTIAATTFAEFKKYLDKDSALTRRFQKVIVNEPSNEATVYMLRELAPNLQHHHGILITDAAIEAAVSLSKRYLPERQLPDKAISVLDAACASVALSQNSKPEIIEDIEQQIRFLKSQQDAYRKDRDFFAKEQANTVDIAAKIEEQQQKLDAYLLKWQHESELKDEIIDLHNQSSLSHDEQLKLKQLNESFALLQSDNSLVLLKVDERAIATVIEQWTAIPVGDMVNKERHKLLDLKSQLDKRIIGQDAAKEALVKSLQISRAGLADNRKPLGVYLFCGPSGVGKTETALALAEDYFGPKEALVTINMTEYKEEYKISGLIGAPAGYAGFGEGGVLTEAVRNNPYCLLLLDEMEKAHTSIHDLFYQVFDKGEIRDSEGRSINFKNVLIVITSNAADNKICDISHAFPEIDAETLGLQIMTELQDYFKPAFLGRLKIVPFFPLTNAELTEIVLINLNKVKSKVGEIYKANFKWSNDCIVYILNKNKELMIGARGIEHIIERDIMAVLAYQLINKYSNNNVLMINAYLDKKSGCLSFIFE